MEHSIPAELWATPLPLVAVVGLLDRPYPPAHAAKWQKLDELLWSMLSGRTNSDGTQRQPLAQYMRVTRDHTYPPRKLRGPANQPRGILKTSWLHKHRNMLPAVIVLTYLFETYDPDWRDRDGQVINEILSHRRAVQDRGIHVVVAMLCASERDEARVTQERMTIIRNACGLDFRSTMFVYLPGSNLREYVATVERNVLEHAYAVYREHGKRLKTQRDRAARSGVQDLVVRYQYKIAMYAELRQDTKTALKYYDAAYMALLDLIPATRTPLRMTELKVVAQHINFKVTAWSHAQLCRLQIVNNMAEAAAQLHKHVMVWLPIVGPEALQHEHWCYIALQCVPYRTFGDLLEFATRLGIPMQDRVQHAGYYYHLAANYTMHRKRVAAGLGDQRVVPMDRSVVEKYENAPRDYIGKPPEHKAHPLDMDGPAASGDVMELEEYLAISRDYEARLDLSKVVIELLSKSYDLFRKYKNLRMSLYMASLIAQEFIASGDYATAYTYCTKIAKNYRKERWSAILADVLDMSLQCARKLDLTDDEIALSLEFISEAVAAPADHRQAIQGAVLDMISRRTASMPLVLDMDQLSAFLEVKVQWPEAAVPASPATPFHVLLRNNAPLPVTLASLRVELASPASTFTVVHTASADALPARRIGAHVAWIGLTPFQPAAGSTAALEAQGALTIEPNRIYVIALAVDTTAVREAKEQCASVTLALGEAVGHVDVVYRIAERPAPAHKARPSTWLPEPPPTDADPAVPPPVYHAVTRLEHVDELSAVKVLARQPRVKITARHAAGPAMLDEWYPISVVVDNQEDFAVHAVIDAEVRPPIDTKSEARGFLARDAADLPTGKVALLGMELSRTLPPGSEDTVTVFLRSPRVPGDRIVTFTVRYRPVEETALWIPSDESVVAVDERIPVVKAFAVTTTFAPQPAILPSHEVLLDDLDWRTPSRADLFLLTMAVRVMAPHALFVHSAHFSPTPAAEGEKRGVHIQVVSAGDHSATNDTRWAPNVTNAFLYQIKTATALNAPDGMVPIGFLQIKWRRDVIPLAAGWEASPATAPLGQNLFAVTKIPVFAAERPKAPFRTVVGLRRWHALDIPPVLSQGEVVTIVYNIRNETGRAEEVGLSQVIATVDTAEGFLLSGYRQHKVRLLPHTTQSIMYNCLPVHTGQRALPLLRLVTTKDDGASYTIGPFVTMVQ